MKIYTQNKLCVLAIYQLLDEWLFKKKIIHMLYKRTWVYNTY